MSARLLRANSAAGGRSRRRRRQLLGRVLFYLAVLAVVLCVVAPFAWLVISSVSTRAALTSKPLQWLPDHLDLSNYFDIFVGGGSSTSVHRSVRAGALNSVIVAGLATLVSLVAGSLSAYAVSRLRFRLKGAFLATMLATQLLPTVVIIIPMYVVFRSIGLLDTVFALMLADIAIILPLITWILKGYFDGIPTSLEDAARIDGCTRASALFRVVLPLSSSGLAAGSLSHARNGLRFAVDARRRWYRGATHPPGRAPGASRKRGSARRSPARRRRLSAAELPGNACPLALLAAARVARGTCGLEGHRVD